MWRSAQAAKIYPAAAALAAILLGMAYLAANPAAITPSQDALGYDLIGLNLSSGRGFSLDGNEPTALRGPAYPAFLALVYGVFGHNYTAVWILQIGIHAANLLLVIWIAGTLFSARAGAAAGLLYLVYPAFLIYTGLILTETLTILLLLGSTALLLAAVRRGALLLAGLSGGLLGLATLARPSTLLYPLFLCLALLAFRATRPLLRYGVVLGGVMLISVLPWTARNYVVFGRFIPVSVFSGYNLYLGTLPRGAGGAEVEGFIGRFYQDPVAEDRWALEQGVRNIAADPLGYAARMPGKLAYFFLPEGMAVVGSSRTPQGLALIAFQFGVLGLAGVGLYRARREAGAILLAAPVVYFAGLHLLLISTPRFNLPVMPLVLILSGVGVSSVGAKHLP